MTTQTIEIKLKAGEAEKLRAAHHKGDTASAVRAAINESLERARLKAQYPRPHAPNAATARALRSKERGRRVE